MGKRKLAVVPEKLKLDLGCGKNKKEGFLGVDIMEGADVTLDLRKPWPWADGSVEEVHCSHFLEHLTGEERVHFFNELERVLAKTGRATIIVPHWSSSRAYGDITHQWPPVVEMFWYYLDAAWRNANAPHVPFKCNLSVTWGYGLAPMWAMKSQEAQTFAITHYREVATDMIATLTKKAS